jgi:hypothetical protein
MNHKNIYSNIISKANIRNSLKGGGIFLETHHIIPRACGGSNDKSNLVNLTTREHFIAHVLLTKIYKGTEHEHKMVRAAFLMSRGEKNSSRVYETIKNIHISNLRNQTISDKQKAAISKANLGNKGRSGLVNNENQKNASIETSNRRKRGNFTEKELRGFAIVAEKNRLRCVGKKPANTCIINYNGIVYNGWGELQDETGVTRYKYKKYFNNMVGN